MLALPAIHVHGSRRRYRTSQGGKVLTRPSRDAMKKIRRRLADELHAMRGAPAAEVIYMLSPVIRGQANYYRSGASKKSFQALDSHLWQQLYKWARRRHPKKGRIGGRRKMAPPLSGNRARWVRDVTYQEDKSLVRTGNAPRVMTSLRSLAISLLRLSGATSIATALRHHAARTERPIALLLTS